MRCSKCQREILPGQKFCNHCGQSIDDTPVLPKEEYAFDDSMPKCHACNAPLSPGVKFCKVCGVPVLRETTDKKKGSPAVLILSIILAVVLILGGVGVYLAMNDELPFLSSTEQTDNNDEDNKEENDDKGENNKGSEDDSEDTNNNDSTNASDDSEEPSEEETSSIKEGTEKSEDAEESEESEEFKEPKEPEEAEPPISSYDDDYLFPSDRVYITEYDLRNYSKSQVALIRNEIFARHGYIFQTEPYITYFNSKSWYVPNENFSTEDFNRYEKANVDFLVQYEEENGWN